MDKAPVLCDLYLSQVRKDMEEWNMKLATKLVEFQGRILPQEKILHGGPAGQVVKSDAGYQTDWTRELRSKQYHHTD
jgi:hypothetical protein